MIERQRGAVDRSRDPLCHPSTALIGREIRPVVRRRHIVRFRTSPPNILCCSHVRCPFATSKHQGRREEVGRIARGDGGLRELVAVDSSVDEPPAIGICQASVAVVTDTERSTGGRAR
jgi:hypothetical protein